MEFINYFFASIISFLGLAAGILLIKIAPEEQKPLKKYFEICRKSILILIFLFAILNFYKNSVYLVITIAYGLFVFFVEYSLKDQMKKSIISYGLFGILFYLSSKNQIFFLIESSLIFIYGIAAASLLYTKKENNRYKLIFYNTGFILLANLLYLI
ncbi:MAG: hypothetical protein AABX00_02375 [Nanoarchaeota archaeon]